MRIRELRLAGFKSFVDPTRLPIEPGLTGVVGPNGCGKSNLLEAVRWVMGAASAKALRADDMDSVIFSGSSGRPSRETADVAIVLEDAAGKFAGDPGAETLEVTRRIRREAGSTYKINGRDARAKDVQLLFADASTGANSPALVRQGQISELISAKPENRRRILEEAAGVAGLHARRHEADLKLRAAEANLARVDDALKDMEQQTSALRRQARQAERYREIADELRRTEALLAARLWRDAGDALEASRAALRAAERDVATAAEAASVAQRRAMEAEARLGPAQEEAMIAAAVMRGLEGKRIGLERDAAEIAAAAERRARDVARSDEDAARATRDGDDARAALARLDAERATLGDDDVDAQDLAAAQTRAAEADAARLAAEAEADRLDAAARAAIDAAARAAAAHRAARDRLDRATQRLAALERDRAALTGDASLPARRAAAAKDAHARAAEAKEAQARVAAAEAALSEADAAERMAREARDTAVAALRALDAEIAGLTAAAGAAGPKIKAPALDAVQAAPGYEKAVAAALGEDATASLDAREAAAWTGAAVTSPTAPAGTEPLSAYVTAPPELAARLALCFVAPAEKAAALRAALAPGMRIVTREGDLHRWDGLVRRAGAAQTAAAARLEQRNRLAAATKKAAAARTTAEAAENAWRTAGAARAAAAEALKTARAAAPGAQTAAAAAEKAVSALDLEIARQETRRAALDGQHAELAAECAEAQAALEAAPAPAQTTIDEAAIAAARQAAQAARATAADAQASLAAIVRARTLRAERRSAIARERAEWVRRAEDAASRATVAAAAKRALDAEAAKAAGAPAQIAAAQTRLAEEMRVAEARASAAADALAQAQSRARD
ncbi:MAG: AAA family ATPase, partial [Alphaproteobacteria bacterium]|nr:AAA family ATPase [Alphaproteobacteria bacterium]